VVEEGMGRAAGRPGAEHGDKVRGEDEGDDHEDHDHSESIMTDEKRIISSE